MKKEGNKSLSIEVIDSYHEDKNIFLSNDEVFETSRVKINATGTRMKDNPKSFRLLFDELELGSIIGRGASSVVLEGKHIPSGTHLALKVINLFDVSKREQLVREIVTLYDAQCPNLITFYGAFYREGAITIALEYMDGGSLANVINQVGPIPEYALANMAYQILWGLAYLKHEKRVHRDIKPSNLLINSKGEVKVTDFGVSAELQSSLAMCGTFVGTFKYMSPERIINAPYSYMSDIWSLGIVLQESATGSYPLAMQGACIEMAQTILDAQVPDLPSNFSPEFRDFLGHCLRKEPNTRLSAEALLSHPWLLRYQASSFEAARTTVQKWIHSLGDDEGSDDDGEVPTHK